MTLPSSLFLLQILLLRVKEGSRVAVALILIQNHFMGLEHLCSYAECSWDPREGHLREGQHFELSSTLPPQAQPHPSDRYTSLLSQWLL